MFISRIHIQSEHHQSQKGVALVTALFVLVIMSSMAAAVLISSLSEIRMSAGARNSEKALKLAEHGVQVARATIQEGAVSGSLASVDGFADGGYFFTSMGSGMPGSEKWEQWHYDAGITGNNVQSEVTTPLRPVWMKESPGRNGIMSGTSQFTINNVYPIVAGGAYFPIEFDTDTALRAVDEYTGQEGVRFNPENSAHTWIGDSNGDKTNIDAANNNYAVLMSPMASYSNISTIPGKATPQITQQTIYFTYSGDVNGGNASTASDRTSTVRLRAINSLCNATPTTQTNVLWEFDTKIHGFGTAPAVFDPSPGQPGDEIIYFAVTGLEGTDLRSKTRIQEHPYLASQTPEELYIFAIVDDTSFVDGFSDECSKTGSYRLKWAHPFPDPDVADWTDYPTEEATGTNGMFPPYTRKPSDITPFLPEDDLLFDYRDSFRGDGMQNHVRGNMYVGYFQPTSVSPVVLNPLYELDGINVNGAKMVTTNRQDTIDGVLKDPNDSTSLAYGDPADPLIEINLVYVAHPMRKQDINKAMGYNDYGTRGWGRDYGLKKYSTVQTRVIAMRDRLDGSCDSDNNSSNGLDGNDCVWNWNSAKSRFPTFKWSYRLPAHDPSRSDPRPWNGYGEFVWETWFEQQIAPMIGSVDSDQDGTEWENFPNSEGGTRNLYATVYSTYESLSFPDESGSNNGMDGPTTAQGSPLNFSNDAWGDSHLMVMGIRDTWDDYMEGQRTNPMFDKMVTADNDYAVRVESNPVEDYWTHDHNGADAAVTAGTKKKINEANGGMVRLYYPTDPTETVITYSTAENTQWAGNTDKIGLARPYVWTEALWESNVDNGHDNRDLDRQGWAGSGLNSYNTSYDLDPEGETSTMCRECLDGDGLIVSVFNHDLSSYEDLRMHAVNATTGQHVWDYHMPATLSGDYFNATPAIANGLVFVAYTARNGDRQGAFMRVLDADTGEQKQEIYFDNDYNSVSAFDGNRAGRADALLLPPTIANGAVYVGTYHFRSNLRSQSDDTVRIYAFSPVLRMFSMGVYPMEQPADTTQMPDLDAIQDNGQNILKRSERKIQVWITGSGSKWEEIREIQN